MMTCRSGDPQSASPYGNTEAAYQPQGAERTQGHVGRKGAASATFGHIMQENPGGEREEIAKGYTDYRPQGCREQHA
jgi:hypothetical protein